MFFKVYRWLRFLLPGHWCPLSSRCCISHQHQGGPRDFGQTSDWLRHGTGAPRWPESLQWNRIPNTRRSHQARARHSFSQGESINGKKRHQIISWLSLNYVILFWYRMAADTPRRLCPKSSGQVLSWCTGNSSNVTYTSRSIHPTRLALRQWHSTGQLPSAWKCKRSNHEKMLYIWAYTGPQDS